VSDVVVLFRHHYLHLSSSLPQNLFICPFTIFPQQCVSLNNQWPKAHVRLASAYIALGGHSNDACLSLQRALSLDKTNTAAREMLVKEMRRRNNRERCGESVGIDSTANNEGRQGGRGDGTPSSSHSDGGAHQDPTEETPRRSTPAPSAPLHLFESINDHYHHDDIDVDDVNPPDAYHSLSISQRVQHHLGRVLTWYHSQSDDTHTLLKVAFCFLMLYLALGGRFGLDYALGGGVKRQRHRGNYGESNAYNRYSSSMGSSSSTSNIYSSHGSNHHQDIRGDDRQYNKQRRTSTYEYNDKKPQNDRYYSRGNNDDYYEPRGRQREGNSFQMVRGWNLYTSHSTMSEAHIMFTNTPRSRKSFTSFDAQPSLSDPSLVYMGLLLMGGMVCHRYGINPFQALMMLNLLQRRGGGARFGYGAYQGGGGGFGFGRQRYGFGRRGRGGYY
jgi:hypothetical protein